MNHAKADDFSKQVQHHIYLLAKLYQYCDRVCLGDHGVGATQGYTLLSLPHDGNMTMNDLSATMDLANSTTTRIVDQLVRKGLVDRKTDSSDRRVVRVRLTSRGRELQRTLTHELENFFEHALTDISREERPCILDSLQRLTQSLTKALKSE